MGEPYVGEIRMFGGSFAPAGWAMCNGATLAISENDTLFNLIGTTYGGDGQQTFNLPDLQGRAPVHMGQGPGISQNYVIGEKAGVESVTLTTNQIPLHTHSFVASSDAGQSAQPQNALFALLPTGNLYTQPQQPAVNLNSNMLSAAGGSQPHDNIQPYLCITFIISLFGVFPTQS
ncbi:MAG TPA: tail fiber protein [Candidatus Angelobacter sp.]